MIRVCPLFSGSSGNAVFVSNQKTKLLVDAGLSGKRIEAALAQIEVSAKELSAILVTHEHTDHIQGVGVMARRYHLPVYATEKTWQAMGRAIGALEESQMQVVHPSRPLAIRDFEVVATSIPHDAADPVAYTLFAEGKKVSVATDIGYVEEALIEQLSGSHLVVMEANHDVEMLRDGNYPYPLKQRILSDRGHLSNEAAGELAVRLVQSGTAHIVLGHLSLENNLPERAFDTVYRALANGGVVPGLEMTLEVAKRSQVSRMRAV